MRKPKADFRHPTLTPSSKKRYVRIIQPATNFISKKVCFTIRTLFHITIPLKFIQENMKYPILATNIMKKVCFTIWTLFHITIQLRVYPREYETTRYIVYVLFVIVQVFYAIWRSSFTIVIHKLTNLHESIPTLWLIYWVCIISLSLLP